ncbi:MAG: hypothetical protein NTU83_03550 [Candidatus Hydrogenedentes bacterium]|nr:hypothetical protein [Candidatus Hydrogenedentota bacterium]
MKRRSRAFLAANSKATESHAKPPRNGAAKERDNYESMAYEGFEQEEH